MASRRSGRACERHCQMKAENATAIACALGQQSRLPGEVIETACVNQ